MTLTHVTVVIRTNVPPESIQKEFLSKMTSFISNLFGAETGNVVVELHTNVQMMRAGSTSPMINMNVHHNSDKVETAKVELAGSIAQFLSREISMPIDSPALLWSLVAGGEVCTQYNTEGELEDIISQFEKEYDWTTY